jgi:hypothetical protein
VARPSFKELVDRLDVMRRDEDLPQLLTAFLALRGTWREEAENILEQYRTLQLEQDKLAARLTQLELVRTVRHTALSTLSLTHVPAGAGTGPPGIGAGTAAGELQCGLFWFVCFL